jgi:hypothetical protein
MDSSGREYPYQGFSDFSIFTLTLSEGTRHKEDYMKSGSPDWGLNGSRKELSEDPIIRGLKDCFELRPQLSGVPVPSCAVKIGGYLASSPRYTTTHKHRVNYEPIQKT